VLCRYFNGIYVFVTLVCEYYIFLDAYNHLPESYLSRSDPSEGPLMSSGSCRNLIGILLRRLACRIMHACRLK
jgi:hypothetical protein